MQVLFLSALCVLCMTPSLFGLLSPLEQNIKELKAILSAPQLTESLQQSETIDDIWRLKNRYILSTGLRQMVIEVDYLPQSQPGPREFNLIFHQPKKFGE